MFVKVLFFAAIFKFAQGGGYNRGGEEQAPAQSQNSYAVAENQQPVTIQHFHS